MSASECNDDPATEGSAVKRVVMPIGCEIGRLDDNKVMIKNGDKVKVCKHSVSPITDGWGRGDFGSHHSDDAYDGRVYYDSERCEFRIDDQRFGDKQLSRNVYEFDSIVIIEA